MFAKHHFYEAVACMNREHFKSFCYCNRVDQGDSEEASFSVFTPVI